MPRKSRSGPRSYRCRCHQEIEAAGELLIFSRQFVLPFVPFPGLNLNVADDICWWGVETVAWDFVAEEFVLFLEDKTFEAPAEMMIAEFSALGWQLGK